MKAYKQEEINWKECNRYLNGLIPQIKTALENEKYQPLREVTKDVVMGLGTIRLTLSKRLEKKQEVDLIGGLVGKLADKFKLNAERDSNTPRMSMDSIQDPVHGGIRGYSLEPDYSQFKKQQTA